MTAAQPPPPAPAKQHLVTKYHVEVVAGDDSAAALPLPNGGAPAAGPAAAAEAAAVQAAAAVEDDEPLLEEPQDETHMSEAKAKAAAELAKQGDHKAAVELWAQAINGDPANPALYCKRGCSYMQLQKEPDAVRDFTICLDLPRCPNEQRFQALLYRGMIKRELGDLMAANADLREARAAACGPKDQDKAQDQLRLLVQKQVAQKRKEQERKDASTPVVHRYGTATIEEIDGDQEGMGAQEALVHERVAAWEEVALKTASQARGLAARLARALEAEKRRVRQENKARTERNAVRAARRREAADRARQAAQQAWQAEQGQQPKAQGLAQEAQVWVELTRIPIQTAEGAAAAAASRSSSSLSGRSAASRAAGFESESESESEAAPPKAAGAAGQAAAPQAERQHAVAGQPAACEPVAKPAAQHSSDTAKPASKEAERAAVTPPAEGAEKAPAAGPPVEVAAAEASLATAAAEEEEHFINLLEEAEALAAEEEARAAAEEAAESEAEAGIEVAAEPADEPDAAAVEAGGGEEKLFVAPSSQERAAALLTEEQLDALKAEADQLQKELKHEAAEKRYARYVRLRPSDPRAWSNRAENCIKLERWQESLQYCNEGLAITTPSHPLGKHRLLTRRGRAYQGLGRLQEALGDFEAAEAAAEADGDIKAKHEVTKRIAKLLRDMKANGIERAPRTAAQLGLQEGAAAVQVELPSIPVVPLGQQHEVPESLGVGEEEEQQQRQMKQKAAAQRPAPAASAADESAGAGREGAAAHQAATAVVEAPAGGAEEIANNGGGAHAGDEEAERKQASVEEQKKGNASFQRHHWHQALRHYDRAIELDPRNKEAMCNKAAALLKLKQWQAAADVAEQALMVDPLYVKARYRKAHAHAGMQDWNFALINMQIVEEEMRAAGKALDKEDQRFLAECRRKQDEAVADGLCSFAF